MRLALKNGLSLPGVGQPLQRTRVGQGGLDSPCKEQGLDRGLDSPSQKKVFTPALQSTIGQPHAWTGALAQGSQDKKWESQVEVRVPDGTAAIAAVSVAELKFRLGWIARCAMQLGHQGWIAQIEQHPRTKRLA